MDVLQLVDQKIMGRGISEAAAAREIGVSAPTLRRHLAGEYARSDSLAKYRRWLSGGPDSPTPPNQSPTTRRRERVDYGPETLCDVIPQGPTLRVVDLFSGCGGLSLGFDLDSQGRFKTVLAADIEPSALRIARRNHAHGVDPTRTLDVSAFSNETEIRAFYLDHLAAVEEDEELARCLDHLPRPLKAFKAAVTAIDDWYVTAIRAIRSDSSWRRLLGSVDPVVLRQTSVLGFHDQLLVPRPSSREPDLSRLPWTLTGSVGVRSSVGPLAAPPPGYLKLWDAAVEELEAKAAVTGARGQLASSAARIEQFCSLLRTEPYREQRKLWAQWRAARNSLCAEYFGEVNQQEVMQIYAGRAVSVLLGGPPCQGFSRIGRGKIRSLRESGVQVHGDQAAGDSRNRLLEAYVQWVSALAPKLFLFENVRHFQTTVRTPGGRFEATQVLADAIESLSEDHLRFDVFSRVIDASEHGVPQTRERFFMAGVQAGGRSSDLDLARWTLALRSDEAVPLRVAIDGLGSAAETPADLSTEAATSRPAASRGAAGRFAAWVAAQAPKWAQQSPGSTDAHVARTSRQDDAALFRLMGPGTRWMDYRADESETISGLREALDQLGAYASRDQDASADDRDRVRAIRAKLDGSLLLRLLLETIPPQAGEERHHLLTKTYLAKRDGNHGDWLSRMAADRPSKTIVSHMAKDTYAYVHPWEARTISVREAARIQSFPDWFSFGESSLVDAYRAIGNAVPPLLASQLADRVGQVLAWLDGDRNIGDPARLEIDSDDRRAIGSSGTGR